MPSSIRIGPKVIGEDEPALVVAEVGINHNGSVERALDLIRMAEGCGADAVKFQVFKADEIVSDPESTYTYLSGGSQVTESQLKMFRRYELSVEDWKEILGFCQDRGILSFATPQNRGDLDFILSVTDMPAIKVGADDLTHLRLLEYYAGKGIPVIISAGMATLAEIEDAVNAIRYTGNQDLVVLHCVSSYPTAPEQVHLRKMATIRQAFQCHVGFSDHTTGPVAAVAAVVLGARMIEKHITLDKKLPGPDHWFSSDEEDLGRLVRDIRTAEQCLGSGVVGPTAEEEEMRKVARRSLVAARGIPAGAILTDAMIAFRRPGTGLPPLFLPMVMGRRAGRDIRKGEQITFDMLN